MSLTGRLIVRVSAFSQRTKILELRERERFATDANDGERKILCSDTFKSQMGNLSHILWSEPRSVNRLLINEFNSTELYLLLGR